MYSWELSAFYMVFKAMKLDKTSKDVSIDRTEKYRVYTASLRAYRGEEEEQVRKEEQLGRK